MAVKVEKTSDGWSFIEGGKLQWCTTSSGIMTRPKLGSRETLRRSQYRPALSKQMLEKHGPDIVTAAIGTNISPELLLTTLVVESAGDPNAERYEDHLADYSIGLCQTLTTTASALGVLTGWPQLTAETPDDLVPFVIPPKSIPRGGCLEEWRVFLGVPFCSLSMAAILHMFNSERYGTDDPVLLYAAYNAGSLRPAANDWGLVHTQLALDGFANHYTLAVEALADYDLEEHQYDGSELPS